MAAGFKSKSLSQLLTSTVQWVEFANGMDGPVHGSVALDATTGLALTAATVIGAVASGSTDDGRPPVKVGGVYLATAPTFSDGQVVVEQYDNRGNKKMALANGSSVAAVGVPARAFSTSANGLRANSVGFSGNGTTYDPVFKPNLTSRIASSAASVNATSAKASAGEVHRVLGNNAKASVVYLKLYDKASAPTVGTDTPKITIPLEASKPFNVALDQFYFGTGIAYGFTTDATDAGSTALLAADILGFTLTYS